MTPVSSFACATRDILAFSVDSAAPAVGRTASLAAGAGLAQAGSDVRLREMVERHVDYVGRVLRSAGTPASDVDDEVQRTFMIAARRLDHIEVGKEKHFLFGIALNLAAHVRRTLARRREVLASRTPERVESQTPEYLLDRKRLRELLDRVLGQMQRIHRDVFVLHELEEMPMSEIALVLAISRGTVASRLRRARSVFRERIAKSDEAWMREGRPGNALIPVDGPRPLPRGKGSPLERALVAAGRATNSLVARRAKTLAAVGLAGWGAPPARVKGRK